MYTKHNYKPLSSAPLRQTIEREYMESKLKNYYKGEKNIIVKAIAESIDNDIIFRDLDCDLQICIVEKMFLCYMDGWNNAKKILLPNIKR